jgi:MFS family permease
MYLFFLAFLFLLSGVAGLGYQVLWSKYLHDFVGVSAYSHAIVLATFMGGLAIGSRWLGKKADQVKSPLKFYAWLELAIGIYAILIFIPFYELVNSIYGFVISSIGYQWSGMLGIFVRLLASSVLLVVPTLMMGGTFPAMVRYVSKCCGNKNWSVSAFYSINAFGAVLGSLAMAFYVMPNYGMKTSLYILGLLNCLVALAALLVDKGEVFTPEVNETKEDDKDTIIVWKPLLLFVFVEGALGFVYEITWTRFFSVVLGSSTYSFAIMLAAFITGISLGSSFLAHFDSKIKRPIYWLSITQMLTALSILLPLGYLTELFWIFGWFSSLFSNSMAAFYVHETGKFLLCFLIMLPPAFFIGMVIPLAIRYCVNRGGGRLLQ